MTPAAPPTVLRAPAPVIAYRLEEAARALGVHPRTLRRMIDSGELPASRLRRSVVVKAVDLERLLERNRIGALA